MRTEVCEALGWRQDWPDGHSTFKVWFDSNGQRRETYTADILAGALADSGWTLDVTNATTGRYTGVAVRQTERAVAEAGTILSTLETLVLETSKVRHR